MSRDHLVSSIVLLALLLLLAWTGYLLYARMLHSGRWEQYLILAAAIGLVASTFSHLWYGEDEGTWPARLARPLRWCVATWGRLAVAFAVTAVVLGYILVCWPCRIPIDITVSPRPSGPLPRITTEKAGCEVAALRENTSTSAAPESVRMTVFLPCDCADETLSFGLEGYRSEQVHQSPESVKIAPRELVRLTLDLSPTFDLEQADVQITSAVYHVSDQRLECHVSLTPAPGSSSPRPWLRAEAGGCSSEPVPFPTDRSAEALFVGDLLARPQAVVIHLFERRPDSGSKPTRSVESKSID